MRDSYHDQLAGLTDGLVALAGLAAVSVRGATTALIDGDLGAAEQVIQGDAQLNELHHRLDTLALELLARQQPVAVDLRAVVMSVRMSGDLERVGDYAVHLAKIARRRLPDPVVPSRLRPLVQEMGERAAAVTDAAGDVVARMDLIAAQQLLDDDDAVDALHRQLFEAILGGAFRLPTPEVVDLTLVGRYFERLADHAVAVATSVAYIVTGEHNVLEGSSGHL